MPSARSRVTTHMTKSEIHSWPCSPCLARESCQIARATGQLDQSVTMRLARYAHGKVNHESLERWLRAHCEPD